MRCAGSRHTRPSCGRWRSSAAPNRYRALMGRIAILLVGLAWPAWGQTAYGLITGSVRDATTLQPISGAAVSYTNVSTQASQTVRPAKGVFTFAALSPGIYRISAAADGYQDRTI